VRLLHGLAKIHASFDDPNLVSRAGLVPVMALALGARLLQDRSDDPHEPLRVYADLAGHPFCIFVVNSPAV
jgi:Glyoxalase-like domain